MNGQTELFEKIVKGWYPKAIYDKAYKMYSSVKFVIDALLALAND